MQRYGKKHLGSPGSKSMACTNSNSVNVGGPTLLLQGCEYDSTSLNNKTSQMAGRKSDES